MSSSPAANASEEVNDFLQRIRELGDRRDQEDEARNRKLEEEIMQGRKERQARRERARSISPTKSSPSNTPTTSRVSILPASTLSHTLGPKIEPNLQHEDSEPQREDMVDDARGQLTGTPSSPTRENIAPIDVEKDIAGLKRVSSIKASPSSAMPPSRNSPLSWQRRPNSQASDRPRSRPLSMVATENAARSPKANPEPSSASAAEPTFSRDQIAQSLASKDPAWFRQTADRGLNSPAYRRNQVEDEDRADHGSNPSRVQMPGMARELSQPENTMDDPVERSSSPSRSNALRIGSRTSYQSTPGASSSIGSPIPLTSAQRLDPPSLDSEVRMSPSQGRISPDRLDRPASPTKGMGGFVQSAMMKRSDSVNKRWSVQSPPGVSRGNSVTSNRSSQDLSSSIALGNIVNGTVGTARPSTLSRDNSPLPLSRPNSSHSNATVTQDGRPGTASSMRSNMTNSTANNGFVKPSLPASRSETPKVNQEEIPAESSLRIETTPPSSPSKTMDPRRWSPTKSSWLESALNKPESPKPKSVAPPQQPAWMSEINKAKQKGSVDLGRSPTSGPKHEVSIGGLMRSPPPGGLAKPMSIGGLPAGFSSGMTPQSRAESISSPDSKTPPSKSEKADTASLSPPTVIKPSPAHNKVKPDTPPKKDFRTVLKPRPLPADNSGNEEPEFKNVFGQLRRTKTQNYVAPDDLKDNITRGKAALNLTGGPKKTEHKDEFKDAILKKKDDFKKAQLEGKRVARSTSGGGQDLPLPEALAKKKALGKSDSSMAESSSASLDSPTRHRAVRGSPTPNLLSETSAPSRLQSKEAIGSKLAGRFNPALAGLLARGPPSAASETSRSSSPAISQRTVSMSTSTTNAEVEEAKPSPQLTHMTKARARGPRRKAPSSTPAAATALEETMKVDTLSMPDLELSTKPPNETGPIKRPVTATVEASPQANIENSVSQPSSLRKLDLKRRSQFLQDAPNKSNKGEPQLDSPKPLSPTEKANRIELPMNFETPKPETKTAPVTKPKPDTPTKSPSLTSKLSEISRQQVDSPETTKSRPLPLAPKKAYAVETPSKPSVEPTTPAKPINQPEQSNAVKSVRNAAALWDRPSASQAPSSPVRARSPIKLPTHDDEKAAMAGAGLRSPSPVKAKAQIGLGFQKESSRPLPIPPTKGPLSPPSSADFASPSSRMIDVPSESLVRLNDSLAPQTEASRLLADFFGDHLPSPPDFVTDIAALLSTRPDQGQGSDMKTLRASLYQFSADGKKQLVPSHQERVLFEGNMYLCVHAYGIGGKKIVETNWWIGDEVPRSVVDDADIFAQREAKSAGGKLVKIHQGKETPAFFHALGGIIIIRRGSSNKYDSLAPHILCGRKHFGQIAFDEVDYSPSSLCSGFPYLISVQSGKSYLWRGKGSGIDELSCARLIGMDFGITGEIEEVEDGDEPASFLQIFGNGAKVPKSADHWRMKPSYDRYSGRLFCANSSAKSQIVEISPFSQEDLSPSQIYVLDAFFEIYIIVGSRAQSEYAAFHNALMFAQEYGILAAGMEDRPMVPFSSVVLEGIPRDMKSVFRKWRDGLTPTVMQSSLQRGRSLRVVPLAAALEATR